MTTALTVLAAETAQTSWPDVVLAGLFIAGLVAVVWVMWR